MIDPNHHVDIENGRFKGTSRKNLDDLFDNLTASGKDLAVHFHGGLVSRESALKTANELQPVYSESGAYPLFFLWNSDLPTQLRVNLSEIANETVFKRLVRRIAQFALSKALESAVPGRSQDAELELRSLRREVPANLQKMSEKLAVFDSEKTSIALNNAQEQQFLDELKKDSVLQREAANITAGVVPEAEIQNLSRALGVDEPSPTTTLMNWQIVQEVADERDCQGDRALFSALTFAKYGLVVLREVVGRYLQGRDHGLYATVVEEVLRGIYLDAVGKIGWDLMKEDTLDAFSGDGQQHAGVALLELLNQQWTKDKRITLIGHSTGAIYIGHLLKYADEMLPPDIKFDVVLLAPAATFEFFEQKLDVLRNRVNNIRVFNLKDEIESSYWEVPVLYNRSLLYLVSGLLEEKEIDMPIIGMQRYFTGKDPYDTQPVRSVMDYLNGKLIWSVANNGPGRQSSAEQHGAFDNDPSTQSSLRHILTDGFHP